MSDLASHLTDVAPNTTREDDPRLLTPWISKVAEESVDWEDRAKKDLLNSSFARDFRRSFPDENFGGVYKVDPKTNAKTLTKPADQVIQEAYEWLDKKFKGNAHQARQVLNATGLVDEYVTAIMLCFGESAFEDVEKETAKNMEIDERQPAYALEQDRESETTAESVSDDHQEDIAEKPTTKKAGLLRSKLIGEYGVIASESELQLWKKGKMLSNLSVEDIGGFHIVAEEVEGLNSEADVEALFSVEPIAPEADEQTSKVGQLVVFASGASKLSGKVTAESDGQASVLVDGMDSVEVNLPIASLKFASKECCIDQLKSGRGKFCVECGSSL